jgi:L-rhamnose mutarotase
MGEVLRTGSVIRLRPEQREVYLQLHAAVWPTVEARLSASNVRNYTIFLHGDLLIGYYEYVGDDYAADMAALSADPETQRWWSLTGPCQERLDGTPDGEQWTPIREIWHLD